MPPVFKNTAEDALSARDRFLPRLAVTPDGCIRYVSEGFERLVGQTAVTLQQQPLTSVFRLVDSLSLSAGNGAFDALSIPDGLHVVELACGDSAPLYFQFDWITVGGERRYLLVSQGASGKKASGLSPEQQECLATLLDSRLNRPVPAAVRRMSVTAAADPGAAAFLQMSEDYCLSVRTDGTLLSVCSRFPALIGVPSGALDGFSLAQLILAEDRSAFLSALLNAGAQAPFFSLEARVLSASGDVRWVLWRFMRQGDAVYLLGRDLTQTKRHEADLLRHQQQLSEAEAIAHMGYWRWQVGETALTLSDEIYRIFGVNPVLFTPTLESLNALLHRRDVGRMLQAFQRAMIEGNNYDMDFRVIRPDGDIRYVRCEGRCELDAEGGVAVLFGIMQDMTERTQYERALKEAKNSAERAYAAKSQFLANMSHELRTPLNAIIGFSEMIQRQLLGPIGTEKYLEYIDGIRQSGEHLLDLISDILDMSKIEAGKYKLDIEPFNLAKVVRLATHMVEGRAGEACVQLTCGPLPDDLPIVADRRAVLQILLNLMSNAVKFTEPGGSVSIRCEDLGGRVVLTVADTGIGIPANMLATIARPFEQAANHYTRSHDGSGLGLAITKELSEMHGGNLTLDSEVGVGTTVSITLPKDATPFVLVRTIS